MSKIQILNETQVKHFYESLSPEIKNAFDKKAEELEALATTKQNDFINHEEIVELKAKQHKEYKDAEAIVQLSIALKQINEDYLIVKNRYSSRPATSTKEELEQLQKEHQREITDLLKELSKKALHVDNVWSRRERMVADINARLSMTAVESFDKIKEAITKAVDIDYYFSNEVTI